MRHASAPGLSGKKGMHLLPWPQSTAWLVLSSANCQESNHGACSRAMTIKQSPACVLGLSTEDMKLCQIEHYLVKHCLETSGTLEPKIYGQGLTAKGYHS